MTIALFVTSSQISLRLIDLIVEKYPGADFYLINSIEGAEKYLQNPLPGAILLEIRIGKVWYEELLLKYRKKEDTVFIAMYQLIDEKTKEKYAAYHFIDHYLDLYQDFEKIPELIGKNNVEVN